MNEPKPAPGYGIEREGLLSAVPAALRWDPTAIARTQTTAEVLSKRVEEIDRLRIYSRIDELEEPLLSILAHDFKVDWWDSDYTLEEKRKTLKVSWIVHKRLGTKYAVETAMSAIYPHTKVKEWFEYGGNPYCFRLEINATGSNGDLDKQRRVLQRLSYYKNLRSHLDSVDYTIDLPPVTLYLGGAVDILTEFGVPETANTYDFRETLHVGGAVGTLTEFGTPEQPNTYDFRQSLHIGGTAGMHTQTSAPEAPYKPDFASALHVGGNAGIHAVHTIPQNPPPFSIQRNGSVCTIIMNPPEGS